MRIGVDFDGVVCDTIAAMITYAERTHGLRLAPLDCISANGPAGLDVAAFVRLVEDTHRTEYALTMPAMRGAVEALSVLSGTHEVVIVTARREQAFANARRWSERIGLAPAVTDFITSSGTTKAAICDAQHLDALIDDIGGNLQGLPDHVLPILWDTTYNADFEVVPPTVRMSDWSRLAALIESAR